MTQEHRNRPVDELSNVLILGELLRRLEQEFGGFELLEHWTQGEFHHDLVLEVDDEVFPGRCLVVSTNCNGGVKSLLLLEAVPERWALWNHRCPDNPEFEGTISGVLEKARTKHWFDPCQLLVADARSEYKPSHRRRQRGGGWVLDLPDNENGGQ